MAFHGSDLSPDLRRGSFEKGEMLQDEIYKTNVEEGFEIFPSLCLCTVVERKYENRGLEEMKKGMKFTKLEVGCGVHCRLVQP